VFEHGRDTEFVVLVSIQSLPLCSELLSEVVTFSPPSRHAATLMLSDNTLYAGKILICVYNVKGRVGKLFRNNNYIQIPGTIHVNVDLMTRNTRPLHYSQLDIFFIFIICLLDSCQAVSNVAFTCFTVL